MAADAWTVVVHDAGRYQRDSQRNQRNYDLLDRTNRFATEPFDLAATVHLRRFFGGGTRSRCSCFSALSLSLRVTGRWEILRRILEGIPIRQRPRLELI